MGKRILAGLLCALLTVVLLPKAALAADDYDLSAGDITISGSAPNSIEIAYGTSSPETGLTLDKEFVIKASGVTANSITVDVTGSSESAPVKITLSGVTINAVGRSALDIHSGTHVELTLEGANKLTGPLTFAAVHVPVGAFLTVQGSGTLRAESGEDSSGINKGAGAAIGGNGNNVADCEGCGSVTINSGTIRANGGANGAGIGGGGVGNTNAALIGGAGGTVTINGGTVVATGGSFGAGIGGGGVSDQSSGGTGGAGGTVTINGGTVYVWDGSSDGSPDKRGAAIGGGGCLASGTQGAAANVTVGSFAYEWVHMSHVSFSVPYARVYALGPLPNPPTAISNQPGFVGFRPPLTISPASGAYDGQIVVTIRSSADKIQFIKYTLDGSDPKTSPSAQTYSAPFAVTPGVQVKAFAEDLDPVPSGHRNQSAVVSAVYTSSASVPKTGDGTPLLPLVGLVLLSGAGLAVSAAVKRRATKRR